MSMDSSNGAPDGIVLEEDTSRKDPEKDFQLLEKLGEGYVFSHINEPIFTYFIHNNHTPFTTIN